MKTRTRRSKSASIGKTRWAAYAAASAATALGGSDSLEAAIHYSGHINAIFPPDEFKIENFQLDQQGDLIRFIHKSFFSGIAGFNISSANCPPNYCAGWRGHSFSVSKLNFGQNISAGTFTRIYVSYSGLMAGAFGTGQWTDRGVGFVGFKFQGSAGIQYGWARVKMAGIDRNNGLQLIDYAFAEAGGPIFDGQRSSAERASDQNSTDEDAPDEGSLGGLALGAAGIMAWRKSRSLTSPKPPDPLPAGLTVSERLVRIQKMKGNQ